MTTKRLTKGDKPVVAICYDFDKTLSPDNMQAQGYLAAIDYPNQNEFWAESNEFAVQNDMDRDLAWMFKMVQESKGKTFFRRDILRDFGSRVALYDGVREWFARIREYAEAADVQLEHYIISTGLKEMIEGTSIADEFVKIYASSFCYDEDGLAVWPAQVINYTYKTQFLFRISKGVLDVNDPGVNEYFAPNEMRVPFRNMIYIGDSDTDIPCMKLVNSYGGTSIGVYDPVSCDCSKVDRMLRENRIRHAAPADYREGSKLDRLVKLTIDRTAINEKLEDSHYEDMRQL